MADVLWRHDDPSSTPMWRFLDHVRGKYNLPAVDYETLYRWSVDNVSDFWDECWDFVGVKAEGERRVGCTSLDIQLILHIH